MTTVYTIDNIENALVPSSVSQVLKPTPNTPIYVKYQDWEECMRKISERCCLKWVSKRQYGGEDDLEKERDSEDKHPEVLFSKSYTCHRAGKYRQKKKATVRTIQKPSKKCDCKATFKVTRKTNQPDIMTFYFKNEHINHTPGDPEDINTLGLSRSMLAFIKNQLKEGKNCKDIRISIHQLLNQHHQQVNNHPFIEKLPNYDDVYNISKKFKSEEKLSV
ncbi:hypothetical protein BJ944DRAFT_240790 [Cunninghamella echinulata]|nr:hypothetical protein BJ944DRAFT_240790 [Cunninghamella echinulata]